MPQTTYDLGPLQALVNCRMVEGDGGEQFMQLDVAIIVYGQVRILFNFELVDEGDAAFQKIHKMVGTRQLHLRVTSDAEPYGLSPDGRALASACVAVEWANGSLMYLYHFQSIFPDETSDQLAERILAGLINEVAHPLELWEEVSRTSKE